MQAIAATAFTCQDKFIVLFVFENHGYASLPLFSVFTKHIFLGAFAHPMAFPPGQSLTEWIAACALQEQLYSLGN
jgi:hypothetical protein